MRLHTLTAGAFALALTAGAALPVQAEDSVYIQLPTYRTGPFAGSGIHIANGMSDYLKMLNERDGGINGVKLTIEECETGLRHPEGRGMLRAGQGQGNARVQSLVDGHHPAGDSQGLGRQDPCPFDGLWPFGRLRRRDFSVGVQSADDLLGWCFRRHQIYRRAGRRTGQARRQEDRLHLSRRRLWP